MLFNIAYFTIALLVSIFYGKFCGEIFVIGWKDWKPIQRIYQRLFNFLGGMWGFALLYYIIYKLKLAISINDFTVMHWSDAILLLLSMLGTMGLLPNAMANLARNIEKAISR